MATSQLPQLGANADFDQVKSTMIQWQDYLNWFFRNLDSLNVKHLTADHVDTGTLDANLVTIAAEDGSYSYTLDGNGIKANNGSVDTLKFDLATGLLTIVSALIQSATGYPKVELNSATTLIGAYSDADNHVNISPTIGGSPGIGWIVAGVLTAYLNTTSAGPLLASFAGTPITFNSSSNINLSPSGNLNINGSSGKTVTVSYVKNIIPDGFGGFTANNGTLTFTKGILTSNT